MLRLIVAFQCLFFAKALKFYFLKTFTGRQRHTGHSLKNTAQSQLNCAPTDTGHSYPRGIRVSVMRFDDVSAAVDCASLLTARTRSCAQISACMALSLSREIYILQCVSFRRSVRNVDIKHNQTRVNFFCRITHSTKTWQQASHIQRAGTVNVHFINHTPPI